MTTYYRCCEHCADDPGFHEDFGVNVHDTWCSLQGCIVGRKAVPSEEHNMKEEQ